MMDFWEEHARRLSAVLRSGPALTLDYVRTASPDALAEKGLDPFPALAKERESVIHAMSALHDRPAA